MGPRNRGLLNRALGGIRKRQFGLAVEFLLFCLREFIRSISETVVIYLDFNATPPVLPEACAAMLPQKQK